MAKVNQEELKIIVGDREVVSPFNDILFTDIKDMGAKEHDAYINMVREKAKGEEILSIGVLSAEDNSVDVHYVLATPRKFERIRRITGYLVGTMDRWNDAKRAEERDRVKHA